MGRLDLLAAVVVAILLACAFAVLFVDAPGYDREFKCEPPECLDSNDGWP